MVKLNPRLKIILGIGNVSLFTIQHSTLINETMHNSSSYNITDILPMYLFARQDRKDDSRVPKSAKVVADIAQKYGNRLMTLDIHCPQIELAFDTPFENLPSYPVVSSYLKKNHPKILDDLVIMSPDEGGVKRAVAFGKYLQNNELVVAYKIKDKNGKIVDLKILGDVKGRKVMMIDDIVDSGNTLITAARRARDLGASEVYAYATHGLYTEGSDKVTKEFDKFFVGDTIKQKQGINAEIIKLPLFIGEAIYRNITGLSLSEMFRYDFVFDAD
jgi:ribose-phosphate pyrophosphokinase